MNRNAIIIETSKGNIIVPVENFLKQNCIEALNKVIKTDPEAIKQISASTSYGIYVIEPNTNVETTAEYFTQSVKFMSNEYPFYFIVNYGYFAK